MSTQSTLNTLSIRSYTDKLDSHSHDYHQLVLPLQGALDITVADYAGLVAPGDCLIIRCGQEHAFKAREIARFIVADLDTLPANLQASPHQKISINAPLVAYLHYVEMQLAHQVHDELESSVFALFFSLLEQLPCLPQIDRRLSKVIDAVSLDPGRSFSLDQLAEMACLSVTQFKKVFRDSMGMTAQAYITRQRMEKARALLAHTDTPVQLVAEQVGYQSPSAFARKFKLLFGDSPRSYFSRSHLSGNHSSNH